MASNLLVVFLICKFMIYHLMKQTNNKLLIRLRVLFVLGANG